MRKIFYVASLAILVVMYSGYANAQSWYVGFFGHAKNSVASVKNQSSYIQFALDENVCTLALQHKEKDFSNTTNNHIKMWVDNKPRKKFQCKFVGNNDMIAQFKIDNDMIRQVKNGNVLYIRYPYNESFNNVSFSLKNSFNAIEKSRDGHYYDVASRDIKERSAYYDQKWQLGRILEDTVGFSNFVPYKMREWINGSSPVRKYANLGNNVYLERGENVKVDMNSQKTHSALNFNIFKIYFYKVSYNNGTYWVIDGAIEVSGESLE